MENLKSQANGLVALVVWIYVAGEATGHAIHRLNDVLSTAWRTILVGPDDPTPIAPIPVAPTPSEEPITISAIWLLRECGLSQRSIAAELGIARSRVRRELARLR